MPTAQLQRGCLEVLQRLWKVRGGKPRATCKKLMFHHKVGKEGREAATQNTRLQQWEGCSIPRAAGRALWELGETAPGMDTPSK